MEMAKGLTRKAAEEQQPQKGSTVGHFHAAGGGGGAGAVPCGSDVGESGDGSQPSPSPVFICISPTL